MGQVIPFVLPHPYPALATALDVAERVLLGALRLWVAAFRRADPPLPPLCSDLAAAGVEDAAFSVDALMAIVARTTRRTVDIHCPRCIGLADDERHLLHAAALAQAGDAVLAERALRTALLTAQGAEFAFGPIEGIGDVFATAGLFFRRRQPPVQDHGIVEGWRLPLPLVRH